MKQKQARWLRKYLILSTLLLNLFGYGLLAQGLTVKGVVTDASTGEVIIGATIVEINHNGETQTNGTVTDFDGLYTINVPKDASISVSYLGYEDQLIKVKGRKTIDVALKTEDVDLEEVVVIGYGVQRKKEVTGAVSQVKTDDMLKISASDFTKTLQGRVSGLSVTESSGRPGDQSVVQIRGLGSINGNASPLYVVDGIPVDGNPNLPAEEIESVDVLKDGASAAIYGTRASNGVILITTKRGKEGKINIGLSAYYGIQNIVSGTPLMNTEQHIYADQMYYESQGSESSILYYNPNAMDYNTDFVGAITNNNAAMQNYNLSMNGGSKDITFNINTNYFKQDGILIKSGYERFSTRANVGVKKGIFEGFVSMGLSNSDKENEPWNFYQYAMYQGPYRPPLQFSEDGSSIKVDGNNPDHVGYLARQMSENDSRGENTYSVAANLKLNIWDGLAFQMNLGYNYWNYDRQFFQPKFLVYDNKGNINPSASRTDAVLTEYNMSSKKITMESVLNYNKTFGKNTIGAVLGYTVETADWKQSEAKKQGFMSNDTPVFDAATQLVAIGGNRSEHGLIGKLFRFQYNYDNRYLISASGRHDGSSRMSRNNRYAFFPGVSVGWNISEEKFMEKASESWLSSLKLRASYGEVGNEGIGNYRYASYVRNNIDYVWGRETNDNLALGAIQKAYANSDISWETNISRNIGVDFAAFNSAFTASVDFYQNDKKDMLLDLVLPASTGTNVGWGNNTITSNVGNMENKGFEVAASYRKSYDNGLSWSVSGTFTKNINEVTSLGGMKEIALEGGKVGTWLGNENDYLTYMKVGKPAGSFYLIETDGVIKTEERLKEAQKSVPTAKLGDVFQIDQNGDGKINDDDRVYKGCSAPKFETSMVLSLEYFGFDFSTQLFYSHGNMVYDGAKQFAYTSVRHIDMYNMWTPANPNSDIPTASRANSRTRLDMFLFNGSYLRFRNMTLGYTLPRSFIKGVFQNARVSVSAQNPFTITKYEGYDPEIGGDGVASRGVDKGNYPITRKFLFNLQLDF